MIRWNPNWQTSRTRDTVGHRQFTGVVFSFSYDVTTVPVEIVSHVVNSCLRPMDHGRVRPASHVVSLRPASHWSLGTDRVGDPVVLAILRLDHHFTVALMRWCLRSSPNLVGASQRLSVIAHVAVLRETHRNSIPIPRPSSLIFTAVAEYGGALADVGVPGSKLLNCGSSTYARLRDYSRSACLASDAKAIIRSRPRLWESYTLVRSLSASDHAGRLADWALPPRNLGRLRLSQYRLHFIATGNHSTAGKTLDLAHPLQRTERPIRPDRVQYYAGKPSM